MVDEAREPVPTASEQRAVLPIDAKREAIMSLLRDEPVVIVCGETGSGKTTQLPQMALAIGRGSAGAIAHTQPRRLAARAVAARLAVETGTELGSLIGYQIRFDARAGANTRVRVMTDGILLAELAGDPWLKRYDTVIIDEAHERNLNVDLLLGALKRILARRKDLRVIITSATIDTARFSEHFSGAPVVEVPGRLHPITMEYRAADGEGADDPASPEFVVPAVLECLERLPEGDVLVFLPGEREIAECADALGPHARRRGFDVRPLSARLSSEAQDRVLRPTGPRRVVLATNVAETSLTVPRVRAVVDTGVARLRRYSSRARVERLLVEPISQASAMQRAGRCGRIGPGLCMRLYSEASFAERPPQTTPEILRSNLAGVVLRMKASGLGDHTTFPFLEPPAARLWQDGVETLSELGAIDRRGSLTPIGRRMAMLPVDPRTARLLLAARELGCLHEILPIAAWLSAQDPGTGAASGADAQKIPLAQRVRHPDSDFLSVLRLWNAVMESKRTLGSSAFQRWCREEGLAPRRVREWIDVHDQLVRLVAERWRRGDRSSKSPKRAPHPAPGAVLLPAQEAEIHRALLTGFVTQIGRRQDDGSYAGVQGAPFAIHRDSSLARRSATWIMAAEIVDTGRRAARTVARIQGDWVERVAPHLLRRQHSEPHYLSDSGHVAAWESVSFGALTLVPRRRVPYEPIDPEGARNVFIHAALVEEQLRGGAAFIEHNRQLREQLETAEHKRRERGLLVDIEARFAFYDARVPRSVVNGPSFESWRRRAEVRDPHMLFMRERDLLRAPVDVTAFPDEISLPIGAMPLVYDHAPGESRDGVTMRVPIATLAAVDSEAAEWLVPGMLLAKIEALIRSLPKRVRTRFAPAKEFAAGAAEHLDSGPRSGSLRRALAAYLTELAGAVIDPSDFDMSALAPELLMRFEVVDDDGTVLAEGRDLAQLQLQWSARAREHFRVKTSSVAGTVETRGHRSWDFPSLPERIELGSEGSTAYPALVDEGETVGVRLFPDQDRANAAMRLGLRRLALIELAAPIEHHLTYHPAWPEIDALWTSLRATGNAIDDIAGAVAEHAIVIDPIPRSAVDFETRQIDAATRLHESADRVVVVALRLLRARAALADAVSEPAPAAWQEALESIRAHVESIASPQPFEQSFQDLSLCVDSLEADLTRWRKLPRGGVERDRTATASLAPWAHRAAAASAAHPPGSPRHRAAEELRREVERFRIRLFTIGPEIPGAVEARLLSSWSDLA